MADREKVIRGLEAHCKTWEKDSMAECLTIPDMCPYHQVMPGCTGVLATDALAVLKEQEAVKPISGYGCYICGVCKNPLTSVSQKFCSVCGKAVKWE